MISSDGPLLCGLQCFTPAGRRRGFNKLFPECSIPAAADVIPMGGYFAASYLHEGLRSLTFGFDFNLSMFNESLPASLQSVTFGLDFSQCVAKVNLLTGLQSQTVCEDFSQSFEKSSLPDGLQNRTFGCGFC